MKRWRLCLVMCALLAGCASSGRKGLSLFPPSGAPVLKTGQALPEVNFVDHKGALHKLSDFIKDRPVLLVFSRKADPDYGDYMTAIDCAPRGPVNVVQVVPAPAHRFPTIADISMDPRRLEKRRNFCVVDPKGLLRRELGVGQGSRFLAVDRTGALVAAGNLSDIKAVEKALNRLKKKR